MKILHLLASNKYSGAEHVAINIIKSLNFKHDSIYVSPQGSIEEVLNREKINHYLLKKFSYYEVHKAIKYYEPDIIHAHDYRASCISVMIPFKGKIISHIHNNNVWAKNINLRTILYYLALKRFYKVAVVSQAVIDEFVFNNCMKNKAIIIPNVVNAQDIERLSNEKVDVSGYVSDILFVGRFTEPKDPLRFIHIAHKIIENQNKVKVIMIGDGELISEAKAYINKFNLGHNIILVGFHSNPYVYMKNTKVLILTSKWEGFGLVALEAMLLGKPVLATDVGGLHDIVGGYCIEWLCSTDDGFICNIKKILRMNKMDDNSECIKFYAKEINDYKKFVALCDYLYC